MAGRGRWRFVVAAGYIVWAFLFVESTRVSTPDGRTWPCLFDDGMISMRYARNLVEGNGLVFNAGERVQGFSNPLMTFIMAGLIAIFGPVSGVWAVQLLGIPTVLGCALLAARIIRHLDQGAGSASGFAFVATLAYYPLSYWTLMGMETGLLTLLLLGAIAAVQQRRWSLTGLLLGAAFATRPDALVPATVVLASLGWTRAPLKGIVRSGSLFAGVLMATVMAQKLYYGSWLPNTYTLKLGGIPLATRLANGIAFSTPLALDSIPVSILAVTGAWAISGQGWWLLGLCGAGALYQVFTGGDSWPGYWRFTTPFWPIASALAGLSPVLVPSHFPDGILSCGARSLPWGAQESAYLLPRRLLVAVRPLLRWSLMGLVLLAGNARFMEEQFLLRPPFGVEANRENVRVALALNRLTTESAVVGSPWAGAIPYYSQRRAVDFLGKSDRHIAELPPDLSGAVGWGGLTSVPGHNKYDLAYSIGQLRPDYVQMFRWGNQSADSSEYVTVWYGRFLLRLRRGSPHVRWGLLKCGAFECRASNPWR